MGDETIDSVQILILGLLIFGAAVLYSSVGHAGASGYLAVMALFGVAPSVMKPTALTLNIAVAFITTARFYRAGHFSWPLSWPFFVSSVPLAFVGGAITLPGTVYRVLVGLILLFAAYRSSGTQIMRRRPFDRRSSPPSYVVRCWASSPASPESVAVSS